MSQGILLTHRQIAYVSLKDVDLVSPFRWQAEWHRGSYRARAKVDGKNIYMHRLILGLTDPKIQVDHKDRNRLNNTRENLRIASNQENSRNRGPRGTQTFKGVIWDERRCRWVARITLDGKRVYLGSSTDAAEAAIMYDNAAKEAFGEFAYSNF